MKKPYCNMFGGLTGAPKKRKFSVFDFIELIIILLVFVIVTLSVVYPVDAEAAEFKMQQDGTMVVVLTKQEADYCREQGGCKLLSDRYIDLMKTQEFQRGLTEAFLQIIATHKAARD